MAEINGATLMARALKEQGVEYMFGIVGFPVGPIASAAQHLGITYIGMRNEQAASYAAQAASYLTGRTQVCIVVSGPGVIHALAGLANAKSNNWPMLLIGGASAMTQHGMGAFQEESQVLAATPFSKYAHAVEHVERIPYYVEQAIRTSLYGRPGPGFTGLPPLPVSTLTTSRLWKPASKSAHRSVSSGWISRARGFSTSCVASPMNLSSCGGLPTTVAG